MPQPDRFLVAGVIGWPVMHSLSPKLHNYWLAHHGFAGTYVPLAIKPEGLEAALRALPALGFSGCNLTIPHKEAALAIVDTADAAARAIGAVNCVVVGADGSLAGSNYDGFGFVQSILDAEPNWRADAGPIVVVGAGGGGRAVIHALIERGANEIRLVNRSADRAEQLRDAMGGSVMTVAWKNRNAALDGASMMVNTTNQGMVGQPPLVVALGLLPRSALVVDIVYTPSETPLIAAARRRGNRVVGGLGMLIHQARPAFQAWFGVMPEVTPELRAMLTEAI